MNSIFLEFPSLDNCRLFLLGVGEAAWFPLWFLVYSVHCGFVRREWCYEQSLSITSTPFFARGWELVLGDGSMFHSLDVWSFEWFTLCIFHYLYDSPFVQFILWMVHPLYVSLFVWFTFWMVHTLYNSSFEMVHPLYVSLFVRFTLWMVHLLYDSPCIIHRFYDFPFYNQPFGLNSG